jgi:hypothetical protein
VALQQGCQLLDAQDISARRDGSDAEHRDPGA